MTIRAFLKNELVRQLSGGAWLAKRTGYSKQLICNHLKSNTDTDMPANVAADLLNALGYKLLIVPLEDRSPNNSVRVSGKRCNFD